MTRDGEYLAVYDIEDNRERNRVSKTLAGFGTRVQKSVFQCRLNKAMLSRMCGRLEKLEICSGCILIYRINKTAKRLQIGNCQGVNGEESYAWIA